MSNFLKAALGVSLALAWMTAVPPVQAQNLATCTGTVTVEFDPPFTTTPQLITATTTTTYPLCVISVSPFIMSAVSIEVQSIPVPLSCADLESSELLSFGGQAFTATIDWSSGPDSTFNASGTRTDVQGLTFVTTAEGTITSGRFAGGAARRQNVYPTIQQMLTPCATEGLERVTGASVLTITT